MRRVPQTGARLLRVHAYVQSEAFATQHYSACVAVGFLRTENVTLHAELKYDGYFDVQKTCENYVDINFITSIYRNALR